MVNASSAQAGRDRPSSAPASAAAPRPTARIMSLREMSLCMALLLRVASTLPARTNACQRGLIGARRALGRPEPHLVQLGSRSALHPARAAPRLRPPLDPHAAAPQDPGGSG